MFTERACPACGAASLPTTVVESKPRAEDLTQDVLAAHWAGFFEEKVFFSYSRCPSCSLLYCPTYLTGHELRDLYGHMDDNTAGLSESIVSRTQQAYVRHAQRSATRFGGNYLELGPDIGLFTGPALAAGEWDQAYLFEPNANVHDELLRRVAPLKPSLSESTDLACVPDASVNLAVMVHVLDHLVEPLDVLLELRAKMAHDGSIFVVTHDEQSLLARVTKTRWPPYCLQHPQLFRSSTIASLLQRAGFGDVQVTKSSNHFPLGYVAQHGIFALTGKKVQLPNVAVAPLRLGNIMTTARAV